MTIPSYAYQYAYRFVMQVREANKYLVLYSKCDYNWTKLSPKICRFYLSLSPFFNNKFRDRIRLWVGEEAKLKPYVTISFISDLFEEGEITTKDNVKRFGEHKFYEFLRMQIYSQILFYEQIILFILIFRYSPLIFFAEYLCNITLGYNWDSYTVDISLFDNHSKLSFCFA